MANYDIPENPTFDENVRKLLKTDLNSADVFNETLEKLYENIIALKKMCDDKVITDSAAVTEKGKMALDAVQNNASIGGTLANKIEKKMEYQMCTESLATIYDKYAKQNDKMYTFCFDWQSQYAINVATTFVFATDWLMIGINADGRMCRYYPEEDKWIDLDTYALNSNLTKQHTQYGNVNTWTFMNSNFIYTDITLPVAYKSTSLYQCFATKSVNGFSEVRLIATADVSATNKIRVYLEDPSGGFAASKSYNYTVRWMTVGQIN